MKTITCTVLSLLVCLQNLSAQQNEKPNVLFIISDDLTATAVSSYEGNLNQTPSIDRLASEGVRFTRTYSQFPVCGPSRASMMFGYYPNATTTYGYVSGRDEVGADRFSWAQLFRENGYFTARVGKIFHMGSVDVMKGRGGPDDEASWTERYNSPAPEVHAEGEGELVQKNPDGSRPTDQNRESNGGNLMNIVKIMAQDPIDPGFIDRTERRGDRALHRADPSPLPGKDRNQASQLRGVQRSDPAVAGKGAGL